MQVILLETIGKLGGLGDIANVKSGYARNFLIPQGKAKPATAANMAEFKIIKADLEAKEMTMIKAATEKAESMTEVVCTLKANASEEGKLFGSVTTADIVASLADLGHEVLIIVISFASKSALIILNSAILAAVAGLAFPCGIRKLRA
jgi:large subunit ribosomal protein L9